MKKKFHRFLIRVLGLEEVITEIVVARLYHVTEFSPDKGELLEYKPHPLESNHYLVKYRKPNGHSLHTIPVPIGLSSEEIQKHLKNHPAANL